MENRADVDRILISEKENDESALHFGSDMFFGCYCYVLENFLLPLPVLDVYKYFYINFEEKKDTYRIV